jgi:uncharacterized protein (TIGR03118 family)
MVSAKTSISLAIIFIILALVFTTSKIFAVSAPAVTIDSPSKQGPVQTNLVSDIPGFAVTTDPNLVNPWGIANSATSPYWISDQGTNRSTLYNGAGTITNLIVGIPQVGNPGGPTGIIAVPATTPAVTGFVVPGTTTTSKFIFATLDGTIAAWASGNAVTAVQNPGAAYTGLAFANNGTANYLYAANFVSGGGIVVYDSNFNPTALTGSFSDPGVPSTYAPFNIQLLGGNLYVTFAQIAAPGAPTFGAGLGFVDIFNTNGVLQQELVANGALNAPWGVALAPAGFTAFPNDLLVGNFGNGQINAFDPAAGTFLGTISNPEGRPITNSGLWAIEFGNGNAGSSANTLYLTAGINGERDGLFAALTPGPVMLAFGSQLQGTASSSQTITVENTGSGPLTLSAAPAITGTGASEFAIGGTSTCTNGATVAAGTSCTVIVTFTPAAAGTRGPAVLTLADNAANSPQTVSITGIGAAGAPAVALTTINAFSGQLVGSKSSVQTITVTNTGSAPLIFPASAVAVTNDFSETDTCSSQTVAPLATCAVSVTFSPSSTANNPRTGAITLTDNAAASPQTIAITGTAQDFSVTTPATMSVTHGTPGTVTATIGALGGFTGSVAMTCTGSIPQGTCTVTSPVTAPGTATVTFTTAASLPSVPRNTTPVSPRTLLLLITALGLLCSVPAARRLRTRYALAGAMFVFAALAGCSNNGASMSTTPATPAGQYQVTVTGTSNSVSRSSNVTLTVN